MPDISLSAAVDTSTVATGMASIRNSVQQLGNEVQSTLSRFLAVGALTAEFQKIANAAENIHREAQRFGIDAEQLQVVTNAAKQLGLDMGIVARSMNLLEINAQKAIDPTTKQALAMEHLGISAKAFAALNPEEKFLALADAYSHSAKDGQAYADVAELIGKRNTELIPLLAEGSQAILERGKAFRVMSNEEIDTLHALKVEEEKYLASLDGILAQAIVGWGRLFATIKKEAGAFADWAGRNGSVFSASSWKIGPFGIPIYVGNSGNDWTGGGAVMPPPSAKDLVTPPPGGGAAGPVGVTDISAGGGGGGLGGGGGGGGSTAEWLSGLNTAEKINTLLKEREGIAAKLNSQDEQGDEHAATRFQLEQQLETIDKALLALRTQLSIEEQKGVEAADRNIQQSQDRLAVENLINQAIDAQFNGQTLLARDLTEQASLLRINLDFDEKIQKTIDLANDARAKGLELTAEENEKLAQQLETEKQNALALEQQRQERQRIIDSYGANPLTVNALAADNLRLGATSDVYAAALAASRGLKPGSDAYNRLVQQIEAQDQLRQLQGKNLSFFDQAARDRLVQWYEHQQQQQASASAANSHQQEINYWAAIAGGQMPSSGNPYLGLFGVPNFSTGALTPPSPADLAQSILPLFQGQGITLTQILQALQQIKTNTEVVRI